MKPKKPTIVKKKPEPMQTQIATKEDPVESVDTLAAYKLLLDVGEDYFVGDRLSKLCDDVVNYSLNKDNIDLRRFVARRGFPYTTWRHLLEKRPELKRAWELAAFNMGTNLVRKKGTDAAFRVLPTYDQSWREVLELEAKLKTMRQEFDELKDFIIKNTFTPVPGEVTTKEEPNV